MGVYRAEQCDRLASFHCVRKSGGTSPDCDPTRPAGTLAAPADTHAICLPFSMSNGTNFNRNKDRHSRQDRHRQALVEIEKEEWRAIRTSL
jgi:hypothetical protein